jgi:hypothetical protein
MQPTIVLRPVRILQALGQAKNAFGLYGLGLGANPAEIYGGYSVLYQARDGRNGFGLPGVKFQAVQDGKVWDEAVSNTQGFAVLFLPRSDNVAMTVQVFVTQVPVTFAVPKDYVDEQTIPSGGKTYFSNVKDRAQVIQYSYPRLLQGGVTINTVDLSLDVERAERAAVAADSAAKAAELKLAEADQKLEEAQNRLREVQEQTTGEEMLRNAEAEALQAQRDQQAAEEKAAAARAAANKAADDAAAAAGGIKPYIPFIVGGVAVVALGVGLYFVTKS